MSTTVSLPVSQEAYAASPTRTRRIEVVAETEPHMLVVYEAAARRCLRFNVRELENTELEAYCHDNFGWQNLAGMQKKVDGRVFQPGESFKLVQEVARVDFESPQPKELEFQHPAPAKG